MSEVPTALQAQMEKLEAMAANQTQQVPQSAPIEAAAPTPAPEVPMSTGATALSKSAPADRQNETPVDWKHKYDVVNGMFRKETSELREEVKRLKDELEKSKQAKPKQVASLSTEPDSISDDELESLVEAEFLEGYGYDYWRQLIALQRVAVQSAIPAVVTTDPRIETIEEEFKRQKQEAFYRELDRIVPEWEKINGTDPWNLFLQTLQPETGISYNGLLSDAVDSFDAQRVAAIFRTFGSQRQGDGFKAYVTPHSNSPSAQQFGTGQTMSFEQWNAEMQALSSRGYSQTEMLAREKNLMAMFREGRVSGVPSR
jgi:hypothetical protein